MAALTVQEIEATGITPTYAAADVAGDEFAFSAGAFVHAINDDASSHTVTVASVYPAQPGIAPDDIAVTIPAGEERMIGPFNALFFRDSDGNVSLTYDAVTSVTVAVLTV